MQVGFWTEGRAYRRAVAKKALILWAAFAALAAGITALGAVFTDLSEMVMGYFADFATGSGIIDQSGALSSVGLFFNNSRAALLCILYGAVPFLFLPALVIGFNALLVGFVMAAVAGSSGANVLLLALCGILPHGIFEITALTVAAAAGMQLCWEICKKIMGRPRLLTMDRLILHLTVTYAAVVLPLMLVAALVEAYVTPLVMQLVI